jgi:hypothetical protein
VVGVEQPHAHAEHLKCEPLLHKRQRAERGGDVAAVRPDPVELRSCPHPSFPPRFDFRPFPFDGLALLAERVKLDYKRRQGFGVSV